MATLTPVEGNPFQAASGPRLTPVEGNPFAAAAPLARPRTFQNDEDEQLYGQELAKAQAAWNQPRVPGPESAKMPASPEDAAIEAVQRQRGIEQEQNAFDESRTPLTRAISTAAFIPEAATRMATRGEYGLGDVVERVSPGYGPSVAHSQQDFARANAWGLEKLAQGGELIAGLPALSTMGAVPRGIAAAGGAVASKPLPGRAVTRAVTRNERLADIEAFEGSGVKPFGPALTEAGTAGVVKQLSDAPVVGIPVRNRLNQAITETRDAGENLASQYGGARTYRDVGNVVEGGLERFKGARAADLGEEAAKKLSNEDLAAAATRPAREGSIKSKQDALYERAWRGIPEDMAQGRSKKGTDRFLGGMTNTQTLLKDLAERNQRMYSATRGGDPVDPKLSYPLRGGVAGQIVEDIIDGRWRGNLQSMRDVRSNFRRLASGVSDTEKNTLQLSDMRRLQSSMTQDMIGLLERNAKWYGENGKPAEAGKINRAIHDFRRADQFTRASAERLDSLEKLYGAQSAEQLALGIAKDAMGGRKGGNFARLSALRRSLKDDEWGDVTSGVIREMGRPLGSARGATEDAGFSVNSFITHWNNMSAEGKTMLFNQTKDGKSLRNATDRFVRVADRMANFESMVNSSRSATNALGITGLVSIFTAAQQALTGNFQSAAGAASAAAGLYAFGKFMSSPTYVRWLTRAAELSGSPGKLRSLRVHARDLARLAEHEPDPQVQNLIHVIAMKLGDATNPPAPAQGSPQPPARRP